MDELSDQELQFLQTLREQTGNVGAELLGFKLSLTRITDLNYVGGPTTFTPDV